jgi:uncharacterized membrane protein
MNWRRQPESNVLTNTALSALGCFAAGAGLMYLLDPARGTRRRGAIANQAVGTSNRGATGLSRTARHLSNSARGLLAETKARFRSETVTDYQLGARVRAALGRVCSHPKAITVYADGASGIVTLEGDALAEEVPAIVSAAQGARGVNVVENRLRISVDPANVPALQGGFERQWGRGGEGYWSPGSRLMVGAAGGALGVWGAVRRDWIGAGLGLLGLGMVTRGLSDLPTSRLIGVGAGRRAVDVNKTINIKAPLDLVFGFFSNYDNFPQFMSNVKEVRDPGTGRSHWVVAGPAGITVEWDADLTDYVPHDRIEWQSVQGATVENAGQITFRENPDGSTQVNIRLSYNPPGGAIGHVVARLFGSDPKSEMDADLVRVKTFLESGAVPRDAAQPSGAARAS